MKLYLAAEIIICMLFFAINWGLTGCCNRPVLWGCLNADREKPRYLCSADR
jgi:hypothetical protein